jgi:energy-coupling factor transporter ATP-binding protein EcfA2
MENFQTLTYPSFLRKFKNSWEPGQHVSLVGPTGSGKSWLASDILGLRKFVLMLVTKKRDDTIAKRYSDYIVMKKFSPEYSERKVIVWAKPTKLGNFAEQQASIYDALSKIWERGGWNVYLDDVFYQSETLRLKKALQMLYTNMRSEDISLVGSLQRPSWVPREVLTQSSHLLFLKTRSTMDIGKMAESAGYNVRDFVTINNALRQENHDFAWIGPQGPIIVRGQ